MKNALRENDTALYVTKDVLVGIEKPALVKVLALGLEKAVVKSLYSTLTSKPMGSYHRMWVCPRENLLKIPNASLTKVHGFKLDKDNAGVEVGHLVQWVENKSCEMDIASGIVVGKSARSVEVLIGDDSEVVKKLSHLVMTVSR